MDEKNQSLTTVGIVLVGLAFVSAMQTVPGWEFIDLGLPKYIYFLIGPVMTAAGLYLCYGRRYPIPSIVAGALGGLGGMLAIYVMLNIVVWTYWAILASAGLTGALPGLGIGWWLKMRLHDADDRANARHAYESDVARQLGWPTQNEHP